MMDFLTADRMVARWEKTGLLVPGKELDTAFVLESQHNLNGLMPQEFSAISLQLISRLFSLGNLYGSPIPMLQWFLLDTFVPDMRDGINEVVERMSMSIGSELALLGESVTLFVFSVSHDLRISVNCEGS